MSDRTYSRRSIVAGLVGVGGLAVTTGAARSPDSTAGENEVGVDAERLEPSTDADADEPVLVHELLCTCPVCMGGPSRGGPGGI